MEKGTIFQCTAPNGADITAVVLSCYNESQFLETNICYGQNRLFECVVLTIYEVDDNFKEHLTTDYMMGDTIIDYCVIPELDEELAKVK
jgi:hypothetical protein